MTRFLAQLKHEWRLQRRRPFVIICAGIYFMIAFGDAYQAGLAGDGFQWINGADAISTRSVILSLFGILAIAGIIGQATSLDRESKTEELVLSATADRTALGIPRFLVGWLIAIAIGACFIPGMWLGSMMPGIAPESRGDTVSTHYLKGLFYFIVPNFLIVSAFAFAIGSRFRSQGATWLASVGLLVFWILTRMLIGQDVLRHDVFSTCALLDPFGSIAAAQYSMTWTVEQNNTTFIPFQGLLLWNRLLWSGLAIILVLFTLRTLPLQPTTSGNSGKNRKKSSLHPGWLPRSPFWLSLRWEFVSLLRQPGLRLFLFLAAVSLWFAASSASTHQFSLPTTDLLVHNTGFYFDKILTLVLVWSASDLIHRERSHQVHELTDSLPSSSFSHFLAKTLTLLLIVLIFWALAVLVNVAYQASNGFFHFELGLHLVDSFLIKAPYYLFMAILAMSLQSLIRHRYLAMGIFLLIYVLPVLLDGLGFYHPLFRYGQSNFFWYSLMDGYGHFLKGHYWFLFYWSLGALLLWTLASATLVRGTQARARFTLLRERFGSTRGMVTLLTLTILFIGTGWSIWHQTSQQNQWPLVSDDAVKANIEKTLGPTWKDKPQPRVVRMNYEVDIFPEERRFQLSGKYTLHNPFDTPITEILLLTEPGLELSKVAFPELGGTLIEKNAALCSEHWRLNSPLEPGARKTMSFATSWAPKPGFRARAQNDSINDVGPTEILGNGTSVLNLQLMPAIGFTDRFEHKPSWKRRKYGLSEDWTPPDPAFGLTQALDTLHLGWVDQINAKISTSADQYPLHIGTIINDTTENGRRTIQYQHSRPSRGWSEILSGRYKTLDVETKEGIVPMTFYYDPRYAYTLDRMGEEFNNALNYFTSAYGEPPFDHFRLAQQSLHFDGLGNRGGLGFATEILGWKSDLKRSKGDDISKMAAHMMGMSWFGDQIIPANIAGAKVIHAGLPYWSAGLYLHQRREAHRSRELRRQEMGELFRKRGKLADVESPFIEEHKDSGILRTKGLILLTNLAELTGSKCIEASFRQFLEQYRYHPAPYPTAENYLSILEKIVPSEFHQLIDDTFRHITRWDLRVISATVTPLTTGEWQTTLEIEARKYRSRDLGSEEEVELNTPLFLSVSQHQNSTPGEETSILIEPPSGRSIHQFTTSQKPKWATIDPDFLLPDPILRDQTMPVTTSE
ncbi:MAG: hypothetical protein CMO60_07505 [Verrucomicrobiales bacterium]|nr:hypothetical protein [Verrucomicrobiales bacterium]